MILVPHYFLQLIRHCLIYLPSNHIFILTREMLFSGSNYCIESSQDLCWTMKIEALPGQICISRSSLVSVDCTSTNQRFVSLSHLQTQNKPLNLV